MLSPWTFINPWFYSKVYCIAIALLTLYCILQYSRYSEDRIINADKPSSNIGALILVIIVTLFIGLRPLSGAFLDMMNYYLIYTIQSDSGKFVFNPDSTNFIFDNLLRYLAKNYFDIIILFFIIACIYIGCIYWSLNKIFSKDLFYALVIYLGAFSTFSYGTNGIKAGAAASIFLLVFAYYKKPLIAALICFISLGFHHSMELPIVALVLAYFVKNPKWYFAGWAFCLLMAILHVTIFQEIFAGFSDEGGQGYLSAVEGTWAGKSGFRWDFILYVLPALAIGWWTNYKWRINDRGYNLMLNTFLTVNAVWMLCMYVPFNNRIAYLSWFMLPVLICYPFFKFKISPKQYITLNWIVIGYLAFTCFIYFSGSI